MGAIVSIVGILILSAVGCAASTEAERVRLDRETRQAVLVLAESNDADSLAAAAVLREMQHLQATAMATWRGRAIEGEQVADPSPEALPLMARATSIAPDRADLAWLHAQLCLNAKDCDAEPIEARVRALIRATVPGGWGHCRARFPRRRMRRSSRLSQQSARPSEWISTGPHSSDDSVRQPPPAVRCPCRRPS